MQQQAIPLLLKGRDLLGCAQTGTGKTAAFAVPILQLMYQKPRVAPSKHPRALVVAPTRELAIQIEESFRVYGSFTQLKSAVIFGGVNQNPQVSTLQRGVDVLVATPGRLLDLIQQRFISLQHIEFVVMDEADHMLDMGFIHDIRKIVALLPERRQSLFFSATMPPEIVALSGKILGNPEKITIAPEKATADRVDQELFYVEKGNKPKLLLHLIAERRMGSLLVFSRTKHGANKIVKILDKGGISSAAIHGNKSQTARQKALSEFKDGSLQVLVATDIAARGIDVDELSYVINYDLPNIPETYVHRIGRTGRAQASGIAVSFCDTEERAYLKDIQRLIKQTIPVSHHPFEGSDGQEPVSVADVASHPAAPASSAQRRPGKNRRFYRKPKNG
ncbi:MAG: DEAD/DEAH box helicase [Saprospiraceae bacterium]